MVIGSGNEAHTILEFDVESGSKLTKELKNVIYMRIRPEGRQFIDNITVHILHDNEHQGDLKRGEKIIVKLDSKAF